MAARKLGNDSTGRSNIQLVSTRIAFILVSFSLGQLGDGLNIFQGIYLVGNGWNEASVGTALSLMGLTSLLIQPIAGDVVDKATIDRRLFLVVASIITAVSASTILFVRHGNRDHYLMYTSKVAEGLASSFIGPCLAALTLASFGPDSFDEIMASNIFWGHVGSVSAAVLAGLVAAMYYPNISYCFLVIGASALIAIVFIPSLPQGDALLGRGFRRNVTTTEEGEATPLITPTSSCGSDTNEQEEEETPPQAASYKQVFLEFKTCLLCLTGFFFQYVPRSAASPILTLGQFCQRQCFARFGRTHGTIQGRIVQTQSLGHSLYRGRNCHGPDHHGLGHTLGRHLHGTGRWPQTTLYGGIGESADSVWAHYSFE